MSEIKTLSLVFGVFGAFQMLVGIASGVCFAMFGFLPLLSNDDDGAMIGGLFMVFAVLFTAIIVVFAVPNLLAAWGLSKGKKWAAIVAAISSVFMLFSFPVGTMIAVYTLYTLSKPENQAALT